MAYTHIKGPVDLLQLRDIFSNNETVTVLFTKTDGSVRDMFCTLSEAFLPDMEPAVEREEVSPDTGETKPFTTFTVWDIESDAWRCFRIDSVLEIIL